MKLTRDETQTFHDSGFVLRRGLFREDEVRAARAALERLYATAQTLPATGDHDGAFFALGQSPEGAVVVQRVVWAGGAEQGLLRLSEDPRLVEPALALLGAGHCEQLLCQAHYKMPNDGVAFDWHQDIQHRDKGGGTWRDVNGRGSFVQTILLVDDMTEQNGPLEFVPIDAVELDASRRLVKGSVDASRAVSVTGRAGDVLFFGPYAVHGSVPNQSSIPRRVLINGYAAPGANKRFTPATARVASCPRPYRCAARCDRRELGARAFGRSRRGRDGQGPVCQIAHPRHYWHTCADPCFVLHRKIAPRDHGAPLAFPPFQMKAPLVAGAFLGLFALTVAACTATTNVSPSALEHDAAPPVDDSLDSGLDDAARPRPLAPKVANAGGTVVASPKLLVATFAGEPEALALETFAKEIGATPYWKDVTAQYGVGPATFARSVTIAETPATITDAAIETWLAGQLDGTHPEWGTPDPNTIYTIVYTKQTQVLVDGEACSGGPAWHGEIGLASKIRVPYAVITRCDPFAGLAGIDYLTAGLSHEWVEAATNPFYYTNPAWSKPVGDDAPWATVTVGELADMCTTTGGVYFKPAGFPFTVQRSWSNTSAAAGHDPCVPAPAEPYFNSAPLPTDRIATGGAIRAASVPGIAVAVGESRTVDVELFSDGETSEPWHVEAVDYARAMGLAADLTLKFDRTRGKSGDVLHMTITRVKRDEGLGGAAIFVISSKLGLREYLWVGVAGDAAH